MMQNLARVYLPHPGIKYSEFWDVLRSILPGPKVPGKGPKERIGIAVSGGLDSMALARLCSGPKTNTKHSVDFHAFIVDHKARAGSAEEAKLVASRLQKLGLNSTILTLQWPSEVKPAELPNFESEARRLRYQALGKACREKQIRSLLLAHHSDDQAETVFLRLAGGHLGVGLKGMGSAVEIPECWGLHGVHQSGIHPESSFLKAVNDLDGSHGNQEKPHNDLNDRKKTKLTIDFEDGGIKIYRPLLNFSKNRLQATCFHFQIPWMEDETNKDASKTPRNAVRQLLNSGELPKALQKPSLLAVAERARYESVKRISDVEIWFCKTLTLVFDVRSGVMVVRMPARLMPTKRDSEAYSVTGLAHAKFGAGLFLRRLLEFVSPEESISIRQLEFAINSIFPELDDPEATAVDKRLQRSDFTAASVRMQRIESPLEKDSDESERSRNHLDPDFIWMFNRQPSSSSPSLLIPTPPSRDTHSGLPSPPYSSHPFSPWQLFDGRYWIRVSHSSPHPLQIRFPEPADMQALHVAFRHSLWQRQDLKERLNGAAPGKIRFTLPVIAEAGKGGRMLAIPTLGIVLPDARKEMGLWWERRYKKVDWGKKGLKGDALRLRMGKGVLVRREEHGTRKKRFMVKQKGAGEGTLEVEGSKVLDG